MIMRSQNKYHLMPLIIAAVIMSDVAFGGALAQSQPAAVQDEIRIIDNGSAGLTIIYTPEIKLHTVIKEGQKYTNFEVASSMFDDKPGEPVIPYRLVLLAIPEDAKPVIELVDSEYKLQRNVIAANAPIAPDKPGNAISDSVFMLNRWLPESLYEGENAAYIRLQRIFPVRLNPVQYNPVLQEARLAGRIVLNIAFHSTSGNVQKAGLQTGDTAFEQSYRDLLVNYSAGRSWRRALSPARINRNSSRNTQTSGLWYTIPVTDEGIYRITYQDLVKYGVTPGSLDPQTIKIFNNGGRTLPESINDPRPAGLVENAIRVVGESDGSFDESDYILFYGRGTEGWEWKSSVRDLQHYTNEYTRQNMYWFTFGGEKGRRMSVAPFTSTGIDPVESAQSLVYREDEREKLYHSGSNWYMNIIYSGGSRSYDNDLIGYTLGTAAEVRVAVVTASLFSHEVTIKINGETAAVNSLTPYSQRLIQVNAPALDDGALNVEIANTSSHSLSQIYLDWYEVEYQRNLSPVDGVLKFQSPDPVGLGSVVQFKASGFSNDEIDIYNISDYDNVRLLDFSFDPASSAVLFSDTTRSAAQQYYAIEHDRYLEIPTMDPQPFTNLRVTGRSADMLIITPNEFVDAVLPLKEFRETHDNLRTEIVTVEDIYNNFSGGMIDPVAIRDFVRFAFENWSDESNNPPQYLLLFGDGHYDYLRIRSSSPPIRVPAFQVNSIFDLSTRVIDDFYGYVSGDDNFLDMAIGRLPVQSVAMARNVVNKIIAFQSEPFFGPWRNRITFTADDEITPSTFFERIHTDQSERIATASYIPSFLDQRKIYLMEYPGERNITTSGVRKPGAEDDMVAQMNEGTFILNYIGHGNEKVLAHEWLLNREIDMSRIDNGRRLFFFYLSSCTFGRWDIPNEDSMGELLVTSAGRGAIALVSAARDVFAGPNYSLMNAFYSNFFTETRTTTPLGVAMMQAKIQIRSVNSEKYHLLGDPSMRLDLPGDIVTIASIEPDSLRALATVQIEGEISTSGAFDGTAFLSVYDTEKDGEHLMQNGSPVNYKLPGSSIFRGKKTIGAETNNRISMGFIVPKDITYGGDNGRMSIYVWNNDGDGAVSIDNLPVGGTEAGVIDSDGPGIEVFFNDRAFISGDIVNANPALKLRLSDPHGINITGEVGHKIELSTDDKPDVVDLSQYFEYDNGSFTTGEINYRLSGFSSGNHRLTIRAWDNFNNSSTFKGILAVVADEELVVQKVFNYPNPFSDETQFTCQINAAAEIEVRIFTVAGRLIKALRYFHSGNSTFFVSQPWDGTDEDGSRIANGVYLYKLIAKADWGGERRQVEHRSKLVIMR